MSVRKFKHVSDMESSVWFGRDDPRRFAAIKAAWDFARRTVGGRYPPGVYKHRSAADSAEQREVWELHNFQSFQRRKTGVSESASDTEL